MSDFAKSVQNLVQIAEDLEHRSTENNHLIRSTARILKSHQSDKNDRMFLRLLLGGAHQKDKEGDKTTFGCFVLSLFEGKKYFITHKKSVKLDFIGFYRLVVKIFLLTNPVRA